MYLQLHSYLKERSPAVCRPHWRQTHSRTDHKRFLPADLYSTRCWTASIDKSEVSILAKHYNKQCHISFNLLRIRTRYVWFLLQVTPTSLLCEQLDTSVEYRHSQPIGFLRQCSADRYHRLLHSQGQRGLCRLHWHLQVQKKKPYCL